MLPLPITDSHMHVFGPTDRYPPVGRHSYAPREAPLSSYLAMADALGIARVVVVQPSVYGDDNRCTLDAVAALGDRARAVVSLPPSATADDVRDLDARGARGVRVNFASVGQRDPAAMRAAFDRTAALIAPFGWHVQLFIHLDGVAALADAIDASPVPVVVDHMGLARADRGANQPGMAELLRALRGGRCWVKVSAPYRVASRDDALEEADGIARALIDANPERVVWGSDWPHTAPHAGAPSDRPATIDFRRVDARALFEQVERWCGDTRLRDRVLVHNPAMLYGFPPQ